MPVLTRRHVKIKDKFNFRGKQQQHKAAHWSYHMYNVTITAISLTLVSLFQNHNTYAKVSITSVGNIFCLSTPQNVHISA
jgi:hypothetical protein